MADENEKVEIAEETTVATETPEVPKAFDEAMDKIETENKAAAEETEETPAGDETVETEVSEDKIPETPASAEVKVELEAEEAETLKEIDPDVLDVCRDYGWDDKKIAQVAKLSPELLEDVRELLDEEQKPETKEAPAVKKAAEAEVEKSKEAEEIKFDLDPDVVGADVKSAIDKMAARLNEQQKGLSEQQKGLSEEKTQLQSERDTAFNNRIDSCFDEYAKSLTAESKKAGEKAPVLDLGDSASFIGKEWKTLTRAEKQQVKLRTEIFAHAQVTAGMRRIPIERAIAIEVSRHKNQGGEKDAEQRLLNKLEKGKKRHTNRPTRRHSDIKTRKFGSEAERVTALMDEAHRQAGDEE